jgi:flagellar hook-associated protein FlgK
VDPFGALNSTQNKLDIFTTPSVNGGTILIDGNTVNWTATDQIQISLALAVQLATPTPGQVSLFWDSATQTVVLEKSGDPVGANAGSHNFGLGNTMTGIQVVDTIGNLTRSLNLDTNTNASKIMDELVVSLGARRDAEGVLEQQAQALVDQTQQLQDNESKVDINQELAQARLFQRSYEASVRLQAIMDEMLNVLINHTGTSSSASGSV